MVSPVAFTSLEEAAIHYARRGWPVFPCSPRNKRPLLGRDKDPVTGAPIKNSGGVTKATTDEALIRSWWRKWPNAMIGVSVGKAGMIVIDFDPRVDEIVDAETGEIVRREWTLDELKAAIEDQMGCPLPPTLAVRTQSGGVHLYYRMPEGAPIGNRGNLPQHIDVRGDGGYVIVPPSDYLGDGRSGPRSYRWLRGDADAEIAALPEALTAILRAPNRKDGGAVAGGPAVRSPERPTAQSSAQRHEPRFAVDLDQAHRNYALRAMDAELVELAGTPKGGGRHGGRNKGAYEAAFSLGQLVGAGALSEGMVRAALIDVVRGFDPAAFDQHVGAIENGIANGIQKPRDLSTIGARRVGGQSPASQRPSAPVEAFDGDTGPRTPEAGAEDVEPHAGFQSGNVAGTLIDAGDRGRIDVEPDAVLDRECARFPLTDLGNAERFRARHGWRFRFCNELGWFIWDGRRWSLLSEEKDKVPGPVTLAVFQTVRAIRNEAELVRASGLREERPDDPDCLDFIEGWRGRGDDREPVLYSELLGKHAMASEGNGRIGCVANLAKAFGELAIRADAMDRDRMCINVLNGTLRIGLDGNKPVMRLDPHRPDDLISKIANVIYDPDATCEHYDAFLERVQPDERMRRFLHQWGGLSLTGDIGEQKLAFFHGRGRNGKSTMVDQWAHVAGDYGGSVGIETFLDQGRGRKGGDATPDLARLPGIRFLRTSEPEKGAKLAEALIKLITGGEEITARHLNKGFFTFLPSFKVTVSGNHKPKITGHDDGIWRRVMLVPWDVQIPVEEVDKKLPDKLRAESSGVLNRLLAGLIDWKMEGLIEPDTVKAATAKYREQSDQLGRFLSECTKSQSGARSKSSVLFKLFNAWVKANGAAEWQQVGFTKAMEDRGYETMRSNGMQWLDLEMIKTVDDFADAMGAGGDDGGGEDRPSYPDDDYDPL